MQDACPARLTICCAPCGDSPRARDFTTGSMSTTTQCVWIPRGASRSSAIRASARVRRDAAPPKGWRYVLPVADIARGDPPGQVAQDGQTMELLRDDPRLARSLSGRFRQRLRRVAGALLV